MYNGTLYQYKYSKHMYLCSQKFLKNIRYFIRKFLTISFNCQQNNGFGGNVRL